MSFDFEIDSRKKFGDATWGEEDDNFGDFVRALNSGAAVRADGVAGTSESHAEYEMDAVALAELKSRLAAYQ